MTPKGTSSSTSGLKGPPVTMTQLSICMLWVLNDHVQAQVDDVKRSLGLVRPYAGIHIRRGDKAEGALKPNAIEYLKHLSSETKQIFLATDGKESLEEAKIAVRDLNLTRIIKLHPSFFNRTSDPYEHAQTIKTYSLEENFQDTVEFITEIEILADADVFVGTGSSNVGSVVAALRACRGHPVETSISMDKPFQRAIQY